MQNSVNSTITQNPCEWETTIDYSHLIPVFCLSSAWLKAPAGLILFKPYMSYNGNVIICIFPNEETKMETGKVFAQGHTNSM